MKELIYRNIKGKKVLLLFILTNIIYISMLAITIPYVMKFSNGMKLLDMMPMGYNAEYVNSLMNTLGEHGRDAYLYFQLPLDMIYPFIFGISYCLIFAYFLNKLGKLKSPLIYFCLLPLIAGIFDYLENIGIITILSNFPNHSNLSIILTNYSTLTKSAFTTIYFVLLIITIVIFGIRTISSKKTRAKTNN
jgi:hypothetical protein